MNDSPFYRAADDRYASMEYRRTGRSGLKLPAISLGLWHNFGDDRTLASQRAILRRAFDLGVTHFDLANNYGPPPGSAELNFGKIFAQDFAPYRDELVVSTKAGYLMHPGPYGEWGSRKYLMSSLDASLKRMGLDYVDIFYSHRFDPHTPLEETMGALASAVQQGKALYVGVSSYNSEQTAEAARLLREMGVPALIHQPSYSMINRWIEDDGILDTLEAAGMGCISFVPLAQGLLTGKYLTGVPEGSRATQGKSLDPNLLSDEVLRRLRGLDEIARRRGQTLAQLALSWVLRDERMTSALIGASSVRQLEENVAALHAAPLTDEELKEIDVFAVDTAGTNIWADRG
ncbi:L-glyceraldehyde 3-phosphate reductase [Streptomyces tirandamycinicus]|uniref:L-glyceraldehyde 3-phosphate reductase n=1 Tax=Streptomyces tirandamycinicus TaxID=2174846 RepID=A0A2S1SWI9_9ACTN|nr:MULTISPECIES: L-glyceraldehyde 3-phosphate reductase [Streptomyces]AWI30726.1 L-glyceraldehyde 3-phosphate reductase [Streptomyces tirandamycinicus]MCY0982899.1 L-glyceraldehyde 3-phosphate reductase [Streptomyces tirandamycinicus]NNJ06775.1 L-glyceraldehyde 3-phosphate reductase [Streptomyces sp. PKU-MA01144]